MTTKIKVGCCGFPRRMQEYVKDFAVVELQRTFYQLPKLKTVQRWKQEAPRGFDFCLKAWQLITHEVSSPTYRRLKKELGQEERKRYGFFKSTEEVFKAWEETRAIAQVLEAKCIVFQTPASFMPTKENILNLRKFFSSIERGNFELVWEPRGEWTKDLAGSLCKELGLVYCCDPLASEWLPQKMGYFRLHGGPGYRHQYSRGELVRLKKICTDYEEAYVFFNNLNMYQDALKFQKLIGRK